MHMSRPTTLKCDAGTSKGAGGGAIVDLRQPIPSEHGALLRWCAQGPNTMAAKKVRTNPEVDEQHLNDLKVAIQAFNDGKLKGRLSPTIDEAIQLYIVSMYAREPSRLKHLEQYINPDEVDELDNPDEYRERILGLADGVSGAVQEVAHQLHRERPGEPTRFEEFVMLQNAQRSDQQTNAGDDQSILDTSLVQSSQESPPKRHEADVQRDDD